MQIDDFQDEKTSPFSPLKENGVSTAESAPVQLPRLSREELERLTKELLVCKTNLKMKNEKLQRTLENFERTRDEYINFFDFAPVGYFLLDDHGIIKIANLNAAFMLGVQKRCLLEKPFTSFIHPDDREAFNLRQKQLMSKGQPGTWELRMVEEDGSELTVQVEGAPAPTDTKDNRLYRLVAMDITGKSKLLAKIKQASTDWRDTCDSITDYVTVCDKEWKIVRANKAIADLFQTEPKELIGKHCYKLVHGTDEPPEDCPLKSMLETKTSSACEFPKAPSGMTLSVTVSPILDEAGEIIGAVHVSRDVSKLKNLEEELLRNRNLESLGTLAGGLCHDFNNLLMSIMGNIELAQLDFSHFSPRNERLENAMKASVQAAELTQQLLTFSQGGAPVKKTASFRDITRKTMDFALSGSDIESTTDIPDDLWPVEVDEGQIARVLHNLILNARDAMPKGGKIKIKAENFSEESATAISRLAAGKYVLATITDEGIGIPEENLPKIFDPYFSTKKMSSKKGMGLGLSICHSIISKHKGHIEVESKEEKGTTVRLYMPKASKITDSEGKKTAADIRSKARILLMDDEELVLDSVSRMLDAMGHEVETAFNGEAAVKKYKGAKEAGRPFNLVILDLTIKGGMGGLEANKQLLEFDPQARTVVSSGYSNDPIMARFEDYGFSGVAGKPYSLETLRELIDQLSTASPASYP